MDISIGIVAYNALDKLSACLDSVRRQVGCEVETILVDNASTEPVAETVRERYPWVKLIANRHNAGFAGGTNQAFGEATGRLLLWLNPDTELPEPDVLRRLIERFEAEPGLGALGCRLELPDGTTQHVGGVGPRVGPALLDLAWLARRQPAADPQPVEYVTGACLLTSAAAWREVGELDEGYFMYLEDVDWCRRAAALGYRCAVEPGITVIHHEGASYGERAFLRREHYWRSLLRYVAKHHGRAAAALLRVGLVVLTAPKLLLAGLRPEAGRRDLLRAQLRLGWRGR